MADFTYVDDQIAVCDDLLPSPVFSELFRWANSVTYETVHREAWQKVWRLHDGMPLRGRSAWHVERSDASSDRPPLTGPIAAFTAGVRSQVDRVQHLVGAPGEWQAFTVTPWVYPMGSGLSLHADTHRYTGAFTYFLHPEWRLQWGGMLVVLDKTTPKPADELTGNAVRPPFLSDEVDQARVWSPGMGRVVLPKPNRLVFISPESDHLITKVDSAAGQNPRISLAGFFQKHAPD
jgi:hypothetical protein